MSAGLPKEHILSGMVKADLQSRMDDFVLRTGAQNYI